MSQAFERYSNDDRIYRGAGFLTSSAVFNCYVHQLGTSAESDPIPFDDLEVEEIEEISTLISQTFFATAVDNFNCFLASLLTEILKVDPRPIGGKSFPVREILEFSDLDELKKRAVEKTILDLGYQNITDLADFLEARFGLKTLSHWLTKLRLNRYLQLRNIITHNRGVANLTYLHRSNSKRDSFGQAVWVPHPIHPAKYLHNLAERLNEEACLKFGLAK